MGVLILQPFSHHFKGFSFWPDGVVHSSGATNGRSSKVAAPGSAGFRQGATESTASLVNESVQINSDF